MPPPAPTTPPYALLLRAGGLAAEEARERVGEALRAAEGQLDAAADGLGLSIRTLHRILAGNPDLADLSRQLRATHGHRDTHNPYTKKVEPPVAMRKCSSCGHNLGGHNPGSVCHVCAYEKGK